MVVPTVSVPTTGTDPKVATKEDLETQINAALAENHGNTEAHKADAGNPHGTTAEQVGLGSVNNTSDADKPVSTAQQAALNQKSDASDMTATRLEAEAGQSIRADGIVPLLTDADGAVLEWFDAVTGLRYAVAQKDLGWRGLNINGRVPLLRDAGDDPALWHDLAQDEIAAARPIVGASRLQAQGGLMPGELQEHRPVAGWRGGQHVRLAPMFSPSRVTVMADGHGIKQLFVVSENENLGTDFARQLTYCQKDVTGFEWLRLPTLDEPGLVSFTHADFVNTRARHRIGRVEVPIAIPSTEQPVHMVFLGTIGQSNSVGAGSDGGGPDDSIEGPQTVNAPMVEPFLAFGGRVLMFNGGTLPHQSGVQGDFRDIAIDPAQLASFEPAREGASSTEPDRETFCTSMALGLNGPRGFDGTNYVLTGSFGFGGSSFAELVSDDGFATRQQAYLNLLTAVQQAFDLCAAQGITMEAHVVWDQGEADHSTPVDDYRDYMVEFQADAAAQIAAITGQAAAPKLFIAQTVRTKVATNLPCNSALGQLQAAQDVADIHLLPPAYFTDFYGDDVHYKATEHQWRGSLYGEVIADILQGRGDPALYATAAEWSGDTVSATFTHDLIWDQNTIVGLDAGRGFDHANSAGGTRSIASASIAGNVVSLNLVDDIPLSAVETFRIAYDTATAVTPAAGYDVGLRCGARRPDWVRFSPIDGRPLFIFPAIQSIAATEV